MARIPDDGISGLRGSSDTTVKSITRILAQKVEKRFLNGTHRSVVPAETVARIRPLLSDFGITRVANVTGLDWIGIPVVMVCRPNSRSLSVSQGKGLTLDAATASGIMEAIELHYAEHLTLPMQLASYAELSKRERVVQVDQLPFLNRFCSYEERRMHWVQGYDLLQEQPIWVPHQYVSMDTVSLNACGREWFLPTSNGLASGNHLLEAIVHAICETIERDATRLWYKRPEDEGRLSCIDLNSCDDPDLKQLITQCHESGIQMLAWDTTSDVGIPSFLCLLYEHAKDPDRFRYASAGMGCHLSREVALIRAITEAAQSRLTLITGTRDDIFRDQYEPSHFGAEDLGRYRARQPKCGKLRRFSDVSSFAQETFNADIAILLKRLGGLGVKNVIVVRLTEKESPFHIVKVIIPGLEGPCEHPAYSPGVRVNPYLSTSA